MEIAEYNFADLHKKLENTIKEKDLIIEEVKSDLLEFQDIIDKIAIHDKNLLYYYTEKKKCYDQNKLNEINRLIQLEQNAIIDLNKRQKHLKQILYDSQLSLDPAIKEISKIKRELENTEYALSMNQQKISLLNDELQHGFETIAERDRLSQLITESNNNYKILQQHLDEKDNLCLELKNDNNILLSDRETLKQTISVLEEKLNVINKESTLKGIYLTPDESKNLIMVAAKAEYENELEIKKMILMNNELYGKVVIDF